MKNPIDKLQQLSDVERLQATDVLDFLTKLKQCGHRGQTSKEICYNFSGIISATAILNQIKRLKKWGIVKEQVIKCGNRQIIIYSKK